jgi:hypothetical protein
LTGDFVVFFELSGSALHQRRNVPASALRPGIHPDEVMKASRCRRGYWWMSGDGIVHLLVGRSGRQAGRVQQRMERMFGAITHSNKATHSPRLNPFRSLGG